MSSEQLAKLKQALRAVQGETWSVQPGGARVTLARQTSMGPADLVVAETYNPARAAFIAACNPATVAELVELAEKAF